MKKNFIMPLSWLIVMSTSLTTAIHAQWSLTGNAGTNPPTNFIGTTDSKDLVFQILNQVSGVIDYNFLNTALGYQSQQNVTTPGSCNTSFGYQSLTTSGGLDNAAFGVIALRGCTTGGANTATGFAAGYNITTGNYNTSLGFAALQSDYTGSDNTSVGSYADVSADGYTNATAIGYSARATGSNMIRLGNSSVTSIGGYSGWSNISDGRYKKNVKSNVPGLAFIKQLRPVTYNLDATAIDNILSPASRPGLSLPRGNAKPADLSALEKGALKQKEQITYSGFIAQEVEATAKKMGYDFSGVDAPKNDKDLYGLRYADFVVPLVKAMQEISGINDSLKTQISDLQSKNEELQLQINNIQQQINSLKAGATIRSKAYLKQNTPNPFNAGAGTVIGYHLPGDAANAQVVISDVSGQILKAVALTDRGDGNISIAGGKLSAGSYFYSLVVNGTRVDTKQMMLTK
ncbi:MAG: tail fiber domain-containing protein [Puia sp.]|nr:tail fiber domain-containing protein [Puia sp.]